MLLSDDTQQHGTMAVKQGGIVDCPTKCEISANKNAVCYICSVL